MAILNITPDSFSDGGRFGTRDAALRHAETLVADGAHIIDIGGESSRPGAEPISLGEELDRVMPLVEALADCGLAISVDTTKPEVMRAALDAGADMINDIRGFTEDGALEAVARGDCAVCAMHMPGDPRTMQQSATYLDVVDEVRQFLDRRVIALEAAGVARDRIVVDPGFGFGKTVAQNYRLLRDLPMTSPGGLPILVGMSRKSMLAAVLGEASEPSARLSASIGAAVCAAERGAAIIRVHDVRPTVEALAVWNAIHQDPRDDPHAAASLHASLDTARSSQASSASLPTDSSAPGTVPMSNPL